VAFCPVLQDASCVLTDSLGFISFYWERIKSGVLPLKYYLLDTADVSVKKKGGGVGKLIVE